MRKKLLILWILSLLFGVLNANELIHEESPYLQQHAKNPVDWMPWGEAAFQKAKRENKMIFLSIGYSTCHWCHVMEEESFENKKFANYLNKYFVPVKVDREEMPQIDSHYQKIYQVMNGRGGGWPLTIIMTNDKKPFFAGTFIPLKPRYGRGGLWEILQKIVALKKEDPEKIDAIVKSVESAMKQYSKLQAGKKSVKISNRVIQKFLEEIKQRFDSENGGLGKAPKFPQATTVITLLNIYRTTADKKALIMANSMLEHMAKGGIYDQIEGGFYRYSTDAKWMIPHFEKMLYTNAELLEAYATAYKITHKPLYKKVIKETVDMLKKRYQYKGLFFSASDADSEDSSGKKEEGYYYLFAYGEAKEALKKANIKGVEKILNYLGISWEGNFHNGLSNPVINSSCKVDKNELAKARWVLQKLRSKRKYPFIDKKILLAWNSLLAHALFSVGGKNAVEAVNIVNKLEKNFYKDRVLYHQILPAKLPKVKAIMEDYALFTMALLDAYEYSYNKNYLKLAKELMQNAKRKFVKNRTWYNSHGTFKSPATIEDNAYRSPLSVTGENLLRLEILSANPQYGQSAKKILKNSAKVLNSYPAASASGVNFVMMQKMGFIVLKMQKNVAKFLKESIEKGIKYPYIQYKSSTDKIILACRNDRCFAYGKSVTAIVKSLKKEIKSGVQRQKPNRKPPLLEVP